LRNIQKQGRNKTEVFAQGRIVTIAKQKTGFSYSNEQSLKRYVIAFSPNTNGFITAPTCRNMIQNNILRINDFKGFIGSVFRSEPNVAPDPQAVGNALVL
jgi:hypothetical protein